MDGRRDGSTGGSTAGLQARDIGFRHWRGRVARAGFGPRPHENVGPRRGVFSYRGHACDSWRGDAGQRFWFKRERCFRLAGLFGGSGHRNALSGGQVARNERRGCLSRGRRLRDAFPRHGGCAESAGSTACVRSGTRTQSMNASIGFTLSHLQSMLLFALLISIAFGFLSRRRPIDRVKYIVWSLFLFLLIGVGIGWAMYPFSR